MNFAQYTIQTLKVIAVWQVKNYVNKMQEKDSKITMVWEKIIPANGLCAWKKTLINGPSHWKNESKAHTGPVNYTWIYTVFERISWKNFTQWIRSLVLPHEVGEVSMAYQWPLELWNHDRLFKSMEVLWVISIECKPYFHQSHFLHLTKFIMKLAKLWMIDWDNV